MSFSMREVIEIVVIAFIGVWLIDKALTATGAKSFAINSPG
jgi:hypothetical protein